MSQIVLAWAGTKVSSPNMGIYSVEWLRESIVNGIKLTQEEVVYLEQP